jgi:hypothetical protein
MMVRHLRVMRAYDGRDPMVPGAVWIGYDLPALDIAESEVVIPVDDFSQQHNQHVMDYWSNRLDRLTSRAIGRR